LIGDEKFGRFLGLSEQLLASSDKSKILSISTKNLNSVHGNMDGFIEIIQNARAFSSFYIIIHDLVNEETIAEFAMIAVSKNIEINILYVVSYKRLSDFEQLKNFQKLAHITGGDLSFIDSSVINSQNSLNNFVAYQKSLNNKQNILIANIDYELTPEAKAKTYEWDFYLDDNLDRVNFLISSLSTDLSFALFDSNQLISNSRFVHLLDSKFTQLFYLTKPTGGKWKMMITSTGGFDFKVYASSSLRVDFQIAQLIKHHAHSGFIKITNNPLQNSVVSVFLSEMDNFKSEIANIYLKVVNKDSRVIQNNIVNKEDRFDFIVPFVDFRLTAVICFLNNKCIQRYKTNMIKSSIIHIGIVNERFLPSFIQLNEKHAFKFTLKSLYNLDKRARRVKIVVKDSLNIADRIQIQQDLNKDNEVTVFLNVPNDSSLIGKQTSLSILAFPLDPRFDFNFSFKTIHLAITNITSQHSSPNCEIVKRNFSERCQTKGNTKCDSTRTWESLIKITGSNQKGVHRLSIVQNEFVRDKQRSLVMIDKNELDLSIESFQFVRTFASCCSSKFTVLVSDEFSNYEKCTF
jgi:hypothetical protein